MASSLEHQVVPATEAHCRALASRMRAEDAAEVMATAGISALAGLISSLRGTLRAGGQAWALLIGGEVAAIWGTRPAWGGRAALVWLLTGDLVDQHRRLFMQLSRAEVRRLLALFPELLNLVDIRYHRALRWAQWTGAELGAPVRFGRRRGLFVPVRWRAAAAVQELAHGC
jgi:hypothetical protein